MFKPQDPKPEEHKDEDSGDEVDDDLEKEVVGNWKLVDLPEMPAVTGEEEEEELVKFRSKIYRFRNGEWKERGVGDLRFLRHKKSNYIRVLVRADKTHKCVVNHYVLTKDIFCKLEPMKTSNNAWTWAAQDIADETPASEKFCAKFTSKDDYEKFSVEFAKASDHNIKLFAEQKANEAKEEKAEEKAEGKVEEKAEEKKE